MDDCLDKYVDFPNEVDLSFNAITILDFVIWQMFFDELPFFAHKNEVLRPMPLAQG